MLQMSTNKTGFNALDKFALMKRAPSIFASAPRSTLSSKYSFLPTSEVVSRLESEGWVPVYAAEKRVRIKERQGVQKHLVRFRHQNAMDLKRGDSIIELALLNSHDGTSAYQLHAGVFRLICLNGMIVADSVFDKLSVKHSNVILDDVVNASYKVLDAVPMIAGSIDSMRSMELSKDESMILAESAIKLRWEDEKAPVSAEQILQPRRGEDVRPDLWTRFNAIQENLIRGGQRGRDVNNRRVTTRAVNSIETDTKLNKALWHLAEEMRKLKSAV